ncbi:MAG: cytochrome d ubiquinol oxidase subunit II [Pirellulales bacterium]|nr:cytochrome d ubiquinol oxidase subunit II [Pirellulales bacterium]
MDLNTAWFLLIGVLLAGYAMLDGFDLGVGVLHLAARDERERRVHMAAIGPVWDGNEVWLITAGGALFAAFPIVYAEVFSGFYLAMMLVLVALIFRAVSLEFRGQVDRPGWRRAWDIAFGLGSLAAALLFGVAVGNVLRGLPLDGTGPVKAPFLSLLNPYALLVGVLTLVLFTMHGAAFLAVRTVGALRERMRRWIPGLWMATVVLYVAATSATLFTAPFLLDGILASAWFWLLLPALLASTVAVPLANRAGRAVWTLLASAAMIASMVGLMGVGLYPRLVPSRVDLAHSLTIHNASSTPPTLWVMLVIALVGMPLVLGYTAFIYTIFLNRPVTGEEGYWTNNGS